jgi:hypothetical protein
MQTVKAVIDLQSRILLMKADILSNEGLCGLRRKNSKLFKN